MPHEAYFNEAYENGTGSIGQINIVVPEGELSPLLYDIDAYGAFNVFDSRTSTLVTHGRVHADGTVQTAPPGQPKPPRRPGGGTGRNVGICGVGELVSWGRCEAMCRKTGIKSYQSGMCGFASICVCNDPPPPPPEVPKPLPPGGTSSYLAPWQTINNFWGNNDCGVFRVCDSRDEL